MSAITNTRVAPLSSPGKRRYPLLGSMLLLMPVVFLICYGILGSVFDYPAIGDRPGAEVLAAFSRNPDVIGGAFYVIAMTELLRIVIAVGLHQFFRQDANRFLEVFTVFGILAGLVRMLDYVLWPFLVPRLAELAAVPETSDLAAGLFRTLFSYLGDALGGNLGILFLFVWIVGLSLAIWQSRALPRWMAVFGLVGGVLVMINYLEFLGSTSGVVGALGALGQAAQNLWFATLGVLILWKGVSPIPHAAEDRGTSVST